MKVTKLKLSRQSCYRRPNLITINIFVLVIAVFHLLEKLVDKAQVIQTPSSVYSKWLTYGSPWSSLCSLVKLVHTQSRQKISYNWMRTVWRKLSCTLCFYAFRDLTVIFARPTLGPKQPISSHQWHAAGLLWSHWMSGKKRNSSPLRQL